MTRFEQMKNRIDNLERGIESRNLKGKTRLFWVSRLLILQLQLAEMTIEQAEEIVK